jgi:hypothetical protein
MAHIKEKTMGIFDDDFGSGTDFIHGSDGFHATVQHIGNMSFIHDSNGNNATIQHIGGMDFYHSSDGRSGTIMHIGGRCRHR